LSLFLTFDSILQTRSKWFGHVKRKDDADQWQHHAVYTFHNTTNILIKIALFKQNIAPRIEILHKLQ